METENEVKNQTEAKWTLEICLRPVCQDHIVACPSIETWKQLFCCTMMCVRRSGMINRYISGLHLQCKNRWGGVGVQRGCMQQCRAPWRSMPPRKMLNFRPSVGSITSDVRRAHPHLVPPSVQAFLVFVNRTIDVDARARRRCPRSTCRSYYVVASYAYEAIRHAKSEIAAGDSFDGGGSRLWPPKYRQFTGWRPSASSSSPGPPPASSSSPGSPPNSFSSPGSPSTSSSSLAGCSSSPGRTSSHP